MNLGKLSRTTIAKGATILVVLFAVVLINMFQKGGALSGILLSEQSGISSQTWASIAQLQDKVVKEPKKSAHYFSLASQYLQAIRENADTTLYTKVEKLMDLAEKKDPKNPDLEYFRIQILLGKHYFEEALKRAGALVEAHPTKRAYHATLTDAQVELGMYNEAITKLQKLLDEHPDGGLYSRVAYLREIYGDMEGAIEMMESSIESGSRIPENIAWSYAELGRLWTASNVVRARQSYEKALEYYPDFPPALEGLGKLEAYAGNYEQAISYLERALLTTPLPAYASTLGDLYTLTDKKEKAAAYYKVVEVGFNKIKESGINIDADFAQFLARHGLQNQRATTLARAVYENRKTIYAADTFAWSLYQQQRFEEAEKYSYEAMRTNTTNGEILYHAGKIAQALGKKADALAFMRRALKANPRFSLLEVKDAQATVAALQKR